jgi:hypothetical protein
VIYTLKEFSGPFLLKLEGYDDKTALCKKVSWANMSSENLNRWWDGVFLVLYFLEGNDNKKNKYKLLVVNISHSILRFLRILIWDT